MLDCDALIACARRHPADPDAAEYEVRPLRGVFELRGDADLKIRICAPQDLAAYPGDGFGAFPVGVIQCELPDSKKLLRLRQTINDQRCAHSPAPDDSYFSHDV